MGIRPSDSASTCLNLLHPRVSQGRAFESSPRCPHPSRTQDKLGWLSGPPEDLPSPLHPPRTPERARGGFECHTHTTIPVPPRPNVICMPDDVWQLPTTCPPLSHPPHADPHEFCMWPPAREPHRALDLVPHPLCSQPCPLAPPSIHTCSTSMPPTASRLCFSALSMSACTGAS